MDWSKYPDYIDDNDPELRQLIDELKCPEAKARFILAIDRGLISGDVDPVDADGNPVQIIPLSEALANGTYTAAEIERLVAAGNGASSGAAMDAPVADRPAATSSR